MTQRIFLRAQLWTYIGVFDIVGGPDPFDFIATLFNRIYQ